jgi:hypothetical protein
MNITVSVIIALMFGAYVFLVAYIMGKGKSQNKSNWKLVTEESPPNYDSVILNYPVALYDAEFGVIVDQAEYHPKSGEWLSVPHGDVMRPYAWYDLPFPEWPKSQYGVPLKRVDTYI